MIQPLSEVELIKFHKMHALGNDFVFIDENQLPYNGFVPREFCATISHRMLSIGCDLVTIYKVFINSNSQDTPTANVQVRFFNSDGSAAEMCANASRCLGMLMKKIFNIDKVSMFVNMSANSKCCDHHQCYSIDYNDGLIIVDMGHPSFSQKKIGLSKHVDNVLDITKYIPEMILSPIKNNVISISCVSFPNPHLVIILDSKIDKSTIKSIGKQLENYELFKNKVNVSFATLIEKAIDLTVFERGAGLTRACASGACATVAVASELGLIFCCGNADKCETGEVIVKQNGGNLIIKKNGSNYEQIGSANYVFSGILEYVKANYNIH